MRYGDVPKQYLIYHKGYSIYDFPNWDKIASKFLMYPTLNNVVA